MVTVANSPQRAAALALRLRTLQERYARRLARRLRRFFREQAARVVARFLGEQAAAGPAYRQKRDAQDLLPQREVQLLEIVIRAVLTDAVLASGKFAASIVGASTLTDTDPRLLAILAQSGARVVSITEETRKAIQQVIEEGMERGYSPWQIANGVKKDKFRGLRQVVQETYKGRAETIARTEIALGSQAAAHDRYRDAGVTEVDVSDGPGCGLTSHADAEKVNGKRYPIHVIESYPIAHPNCRRVSIPVLPGR